MEDVMERRDQIHEWMKLQEWEPVEEAWMEVLETVPQGIAFHEPLVGRLVRRKFFDKLESLYGLLLEDLNEKGLHEEAVELVRLILRLKPDAEFVLPALREALRQIHSDRPKERLDRFFELSGLSAPSARIVKTLEKFEELVGVSRGNVFRHSRWGLGKVVDLDADTGKVTIDFAGKKGQTFTIDGVREFLQAIAPDHIVSALVRDAEGVRRRMEEDPADAVKFALRSYNGRLAVADLKKIVLEGLMDESGWRKWWEKARDAVRLDPWVEMEGVGARAELRLRTEARSFAEEVLTSLRETESTTGLRDSLRELRRHQDEAELTEEQEVAVGRTLKRRLEELPAEDTVSRLEIGYLFEEFSDVVLGSLAPEEWDEGELLGGKSAGELVKRVQEIPVFEHQVRACEGIRCLYPDQWAVVFGQTIPPSPPRLASWLEKTLADAGEEKARHAGLDEVLSHPSRNPDTFIWVVRQVLDETWTNVAEGVPRAVMFSDILTLLEDQYTEFDRSGKKNDEARGVVSKLRTFVNEANHKYVRKVAKECSLEEARRLLSQVHLNSGLSHQAKEGCESILISNHPDLKRQTRAEVEEEAKKPSFHYTTKESLEAKRARLSHILNVEVPENSRQIGIARDHGDLSENAEYHAAKDRQKLLHQQAEELNDLISRARVIEPVQVKTDAVGFGTRFRARDKASGEEKTFTILGLWEAQPEQGVLSYLTPLGGAFLNAKAGQTVEVTTNDGAQHRYEILEIERAI